jgi:hypothetical protein
LARFAVLEILEVVDIAAFEKRAVAVSPGDDAPIMRQPLKQPLEPGRQGMISTA